MQEILVGILYVFVQLLSEASEGRLKVVYGDALQFNIEQNCSQFVERRSWEDGEDMCCIMIVRSSIGRW